MNKQNIGNILTEAEYLVQKVHQKYTHSQVPLYQLFVKPRIANENTTQILFSGNLPIDLSGGSEYIKATTLRQTVEKKPIHKLDHNPVKTAICIKKEQGTYEASNHDDLVAKVRKYTGIM